MPHLDMPLQERWRRDNRTGSGLRHTGENWGRQGYSDTANSTAQGLECHRPLSTFVMTGLFKFTTKAMQLGHAQPQIFSHYIHSPQAKLATVADAGSGRVCGLTYPHHNQSVALTHK